MSTVPETLEAEAPPVHKRASWWQQLRRDKKAAAGGLELVLPLGPGQALLVSGVAAAEAERALRRALG